MKGFFLGVRTNSSARLSDFVGKPGGNVEQVVEFAAVGTLYVRQHGRQPSEAIGINVDV
jgi:hypothetical protein